MSNKLGNVDLGVERAQKVNKELREDVRKESESGGRASLQKALENLKTDPNVSTPKEKPFQKGPPAGKAVQEPKSSQGSTAQTRGEVLQPAAKSAQPVADPKKSEGIKEYRTYLNTQSVSPKNVPPTHATAASNFTQAPLKPALIQDISRFVPNQPTRQSDPQKNIPTEQNAPKENPKLFQASQTVIPPQGGEQTKLVDTKLKDGEKKSKSDGENKTAQKKSLAQASAGAHGISQPKNDSLEGLASGLASDAGQEGGFEKQPVRYSINNPLGKMDIKGNEVREARDKYAYEIEKSVKPNSDWVEQFLSETTHEIEEAREVLRCYGLYGGIVG